MGLAPKVYRCINWYQMGCEKQHKRVVRTTIADFNFLVSLCLTYPLEKRGIRGAVIFVHGKRSNCLGVVLHLYIAGQALALSVVTLSPGPRCTGMNLEYDSLACALLCIQR